MTTLIKMHDHMQVIMAAIVLTLLHKNQTGFMTKLIEVRNSPIFGAKYPVLYNSVPSSDDLQTNFGWL